MIVPNSMNSLEIEQTYDQNIAMKSLSFSQSWRIDAQGVAVQTLSKSEDY